MSTDYEKLTDEERLAKHIAQGSDPEVQARWDRSYQLTLSAPMRLLELLDEKTVYGGEAVQQALTERVRAQRGWVESLSFEDWWLDWAGPWSMLVQRTDVGLAFRELSAETHIACNPYLRAEQCIHRHVYRINSRNLGYGAYNEKTRGFSGIRTKFDRRYIFEEYHWDNGPPFGTVHPQEDLGPLPEGIVPKKSLGRIDYKSGRPIIFDKSAADPEGSTLRRYGRYKFTDTDEYDDEIRASFIHNDALFQYLEQ